MSQSYLHVDGIHTPNQRYSFTNITNDNFISEWGGNPILVKPGEVIEISDLTPIPGAGMGHVLAEKMSIELVDKIMSGEIRKEEEAMREKTGNFYYRSPKGGMMGVPAARKVWEDQIIRSLTPDEESPAIRAMRTQLKDQLMKDMERKEGVSEESIPVSVQEFADIDKSGDTTKVVKQPIKTKKVA